MSDRRVALIVPGPIERTGGYVYDVRIVDGLRAHAWAVNLIELRGGFPFPDKVARLEAANALALLPDDTVALIDGLALGAIPEVVEAHAKRIRIVALVHLPLSADVTRDSVTAQRLAALERRSLAASSLVIATSQATIPMLATYAVPPHRLLVIEPGTDRPQTLIDVATVDADRDRPVELLCVATVNAGKGHDVLLRALTRVQAPWHLSCAGNLRRDPDWVRHVTMLVESLRMQQRVTFAGELDSVALDAAYTRADAFVLATKQETYGMAVAEALAHGLPVIATKTGAIPRLVGTRAGILVDVDDEPALASALDAIVRDDSLRQRLSNGARAASAQLPTWADASARLNAVLARFVDHG